MNTAPKPNLLLSAKYLGPVFSLNAEVTRRAQNLIFARNGVGKSFLGRALRYLDLHGQGSEIDNAAQNLVSDESYDGKGELSVCRGSTVLGALSLDRNSNTAIAKVQDTIFHVFSDDFVEAELRERSFEINDEIENEIAVDRENIQVEEARNTLEQAEEEEKTEANRLHKKFDHEKREDLVKKAGINRRLREYQALILENQTIRLTEKPVAQDRTFANILVDLDNLKALPSEPEYPNKVSAFSLVEINFAVLTEVLERITSPSSVSRHIKEKIEQHHSFYQTGTRMVQDESLPTCPFCEQSIDGHDTEALIQSYIAYFADEEERHKSELRALETTLEGKDSEIQRLEALIAREKSRYDDLKRFIPSMKDSKIDTCKDHVIEIRAVISLYRDAIKKKTSDLATIRSLPDCDLHQNAAAMNALIESNNVKAKNLSIAIERSDEERRKLQREACIVFLGEFIMKNWDEIERLKKLKEVVGLKKLELVDLERSSPSADAKSRVAETFELLLKGFFGEKYIFDKEKFILKRGQEKMTRGPYRTLSDGEKTVIAFCYFVACVHRKVKTESDYHKVFFIFDDPVTSMSYDYIFGIVQVLKHLSISTQGVVSINPSRIDGNIYKRPELLIMTHSSYFFNVSLTNKVVHESAAFALNAQPDAHEISRMDKYVAPFQLQLKEIYEVANGKEPDHGTGNTIRSVLEAVGRFCRPDKSKYLSDFIDFLAGDEDLKLKSVMINSLSHGSYYDEAPPPEDLRLACEETLVVVEKYAAGQLEIVRTIADAR